MLSIKQQRVIKAGSSWYNREIISRITWELRHQTRTSPPNSKPWSRATCLASSSPPSTYTAHSSTRSTLDNDVTSCYQIHVHKNNSFRFQLKQTCRRFGEAVSRWRSTSEIKHVASFKWEFREFESELLHLSPSTTSTMLHVAFIRWSDLQVLEF